MTKDFKQAATNASEAGRISTAIREAAALEDPEEAAKDAKTEKKAKRGPGRPRKSTRNDKTAVRVNLSLSDELYDYIKTMSQARRVSMVDVILYAIEKDKAKNAKQYEQAKQFFNNF